MNNKTIKVSLRHDIINKADATQKKLLGTGWKNTEISIDDFIDHIKQGYAYTHQFTDGRRSRDTFIQTDILIADIDNDIDKDPENYMTIEQALANPLIKEYSTFIHTTASHTPERHRFRIIFVLDRTIFSADTYEAMYETLMANIPTDPATKSCAQLFFGFDKTEITVTGQSLSDSQITKMVSGGMTKRHNTSNPPTASDINPQTLVKTRSGPLKVLNTLPAKTSIQCPFGTHQDNQLSAFVKINRYGTRGVECRSCGQSAWTEKLPPRGEPFESFDQIVIDNAGKENSHFEYHGLGLYNHDLESSIAKSYFHITNSKHLELGEIVPGIHLIKSPKGTGKTHFLSNLTSHLKRPEVRKKFGLTDDRTILVGHRQSLIKESAEKLHLECYLDTAEYDTNIAHSYYNDKIVKSVSLKPQHYAICLDSLFSRIRLRYEKYGVVIIDESEQVFSHLLSEHMKRPTENFTILSKLISQAKFVYCLDADIDQVTITGIMACISHARNINRQQPSASGQIDVKNFYCHLNQFKKQGNEVELFQGKNHLTEDLLSSVTNGQRCYVTSNSKKFIEGLYKSFSGNFPHKKFKLITSESGADPEVREFIKNIKTDILNYDAIFSSPTIGTGIDITFPDNQKLIDVVYGFFDSNINTHFDIDQQLARVRHPKAVRVWINPSRYRKSTSKHVICRELLLGDDPKGLRYFLDQEGVHANRGEHPYMDLVTEVISSRHKSTNQLRDNFIKYKTKSGWYVADVARDGVKSVRGAVVDKASRVARKLSRREKLLNAPVITSKEQHDIQEAKKKNASVTVAEQAGTERYWIEQFYDETITKELIEFDDDGKMRDKLRLLDVVTEPTIEFTDYQQIKTDFAKLVNYKLQPVKTENLKRLVFLRELFATAGIYDMTTFQFKLDTPYDNDSLHDFVVLLKKHKDRYSLLFDKEVNQHIDERAATQLNTVLKIVGLQHVLVKKNRGAKSGLSKYQIEPVNYARATDIVTRRRIRAAAAKIKHDEYLDSLG